MATLAESSAYVPDAKSREASLGGLPLWPLLLLCFFSISSGAETIAGVPRVVLLPLLLGVVVFLMRPSLSRTGVYFALAVLVALLPGGVHAAMFGEVSLSSLSNLLVSLALFVAVFGYTIDFLSGDREAIVRAIDRTLIVMLILCAMELIFYAESCQIRTLYYFESISSIVCQNLRADSIYGLARPAAIFSEPSNFARFICILVTLRFAVSPNIRKSVFWFLTFLVVTRSPTYLYCLPVLSLVFVIGRDFHGESRRRVSLRLLILAVGGLLTIGLAIYLQAGRLTYSASAGADGSLNERIILPILYMLNEWKDPIVGSGPTPSDEINLYVYRIFIYESGRTWLDPETYRSAFAPSLGLIVGMGAFGFLTFAMTASVLLTWRGLVLIVCFLLMNMLGVGINAPPMYVPSAIMLALAWRSLAPHRGATQKRNELRQSESEWNENGFSSGKGRHRYPSAERGRAYR